MLPYHSLVVGSVVNKNINCVVEARSVVCCEGLTVLLLAHVPALLLHCVVQVERGRGNGQSPSFLYALYCYRCEETLLTNTKCFYQSFFVMHA